MSRRALRVWSRHHRRLARLLRSRHRILHRVLPGQLILEALGLSPRRSGRRPFRARGEFLNEPWLAPPQEAEEQATTNVAAEAVERSVEDLDGRPEPISAQAAGGIKDSTEPPPREITPVAEARRQGRLMIRPAEGQRRRPVEPRTTAAAPDTHPVVPPSLVEPTAPSAGDIPRKETGRVDTLGVAASAEAAGLPPTEASSPDEMRPGSAEQEDAGATPAQEGSAIAASPAEPAGEPLKVHAERESPRISRRVGERATRPGGDSQSAPDVTEQEAAADLGPAYASIADSELAPTDGGPLSPVAGPEDTRVTPPVASGQSRVVEERQARRPPSTGPRPQAGSARPTAQPAAPRPVPAPQVVKEAVAEVSTRSIREWRRLLVEATEPPAPSRPRAPAAPTAPLLESTRRFLRPLVGIDLDTVRVHRGQRASEISAQSGGDALAVGEDVVFPETHNESTPEGLALLAHELTHVAQRRTPRFVPPIARHALEPGTATPRRLSPGATSTTVDEPALDEEPLARVVEGRVRAAARETRRGRDAGPGKMAEGDPRAVAAASVGGLIPPAATSGEPPWGNLPAPWEPLPDLGRERVGSRSLRRPLAEAAGMAGSPTPESAAAPVHRADPERSVEEPAPPDAHAPAPSHAAPPPDLDALAQQVYQVLKRRIAAERRREG